MKFDPPAAASWRDLPFATIAVVVLCVGVWLAQVAQGVPVMGASPANVVDWGGCLPLYVLTGEPWRLVTAMFLHLDLTHLGLNMLVFSLMALQFERAFGRVRMLAVFLVGGILANAGYVGWAALDATPAHFQPLISVLAGASGGMMALLGALLVPSLLGAAGQQPWADMLGRRVNRSLLWAIAINIGICFVVPHWDPTINIAGVLAGIVVGAILFVAPQHAGTATALARFAATGLLLAACVSGVAHSGDRDLVRALRVDYDAWRAAHP